MTIQCIWETPPDDFSLSYDETHVWCVSLNQSDSSLQSLSLLLSPEECARADRFHFERDRRRFIVSQGTLRKLLGSYLTIPPEDVRLRRHNRGKPALDLSETGHNGLVPLKFNLSHSHELALYAITHNREVGVDIEHIRPVQDAEQIVKRMFSPQEQATFFAFPQPRRLEAFFQCWTRKEAFIKAIGEGLYYPLDRFSVEFTPGRPACLLHTAPDPREASRWSLRALNPASGYVAALAMEGEISSLKCWRFPEFPQN